MIYDIIRYSEVEVMKMHKSKIKDFFMILLGNLIVACAVSFFILPNNILTGGVPGVAVAIQPIFHLDPVLVINVLTVGLFLVGALLLGKEFAMKSLISTICYPMFVTTLSYIADMFPKETFLMPDYLASIYAGLILGVGLGLVFRVDASTGGMDIVALILHKFTKIPTGSSVMIVDSCTIAVGMFTYGLAPALVGILSVFVSGECINRMVMLGAQSAKNIMIISDEWKQIRQVLLNRVDRGVTILDASGGYTQQPKPVLMCVIAQKQYPVLEASVLEIDPKAFIIVNDVHQVHGSGFTYRDGEI